MFKSRHFIFTLLPALGLLLFLAACKKEYVKTPYNAIEQFTVTDSAGTVIKAAITGDTIRLYWAPFTQVPQTIMPQIILSAGATISPASGVKVNFAVNTAYTVTAQDGSTHTYHLKPMINQPAPVFTTNGTVFQLGGSITLAGQYFMADTNVTKIFLISNSNKATAVSINADDPVYFSTTRLSLNIPLNESVDTGYYSIKVLSTGNTVTNGPVYIGVPTFPGFTSTDAGKEIKRGSSITLNYTGPAAKYYYNSFNGATVTILTSRGRFTTTATAPANGTVSITIPLTAPLAGTITRITVSNTKGGSAGVYTPPAGSPITIVE